jgi:hypothetical protein
MKFNYLKVSLFTLSIILSFSSFGQGSLNLLNGKQIKIDSVKTIGTKFAYIKPNSQKVKLINRDDVFSIRYPQGNEEFVFVPDTASGDINLDQMKFYIKGEQDARKYYHAPTATVVGVFVGAGSGYFAYYGIIVPAVSGVFTGLHQPHNYKHLVSDTTLTNNAFYISGYRSIARRKKVNNALISGYISLTTSLFTLAIFNTRIDQFFYNLHHH